MNNDNDLNFHSMTKLSGWLRLFPVHFFECLRFNPNPDLCSQCICQSPLPMTYDMSPYDMMTTYGSFFCVSRLAPAWDLKVVIIKCLHSALTFTVSKTHGLADVSPKFTSKSHEQTFVSPSPWFHPWFLGRS